MENPVKEISGVIHLLTQSPPLQQRETIETYFTPNASFTHPFCRTGSWENSQFLIRAIYRWYKIMSPNIELTVHSVAYDEKNLLLYVTLSQVFKIWILPFYRAPVDLVTVLKLRHNRGDGKFYIASQNDLYQVDQFVKFIPFFPGSTLLVWAWQFLATGFCFLGALALWPMSLAEQAWAEGGRRGKEEREGWKKMGWTDDIELKDLERRARVNG